MIDNDVKAFK